MAAHVGKDCSVKIGTTAVALMGSWNMTGVTTDLYEDTEFGDEWKTYLAGLKDGGQITFQGFYDKTDTNGQDVLRTNNLNGTQMTTIRLYVDNTSYWTPKTTNPASFVLITDWSIGAEKGSLVSADFTAKISGAMELI